MFLNIINFRKPWLNASWTVFANLKAFACYQGSPNKDLGNAVVPDSVQKVSSLFKILNNLYMLSEATLAATCRKQYIPFWTNWKAALMKTRKRR